METSDPMVAVIYGAMAFPSQRPALMSSVDLVAGQPGPWTLCDEDCGRLAEALVARARTAARPGDGDVLGEAVTATVFDVLEEARRRVTDTWSQLRTQDGVPGHVLQDLEQLEARLISFTDTYAKGFLHNLATPTEPSGPVATGAPGPDGLPGLEQATRMRHDEWMVLIQERRLSVPKVLAELRTRVAAAGKVPPRNLREAAGTSHTVEILLEVLAESVPVEAVP